VRSKCQTNVVIKLEGSVLRPPHCEQCQCPIEATVVCCFCPRKSIARAVGGQNRGCLASFVDPLLDRLQHLLSDLKLACDRFDGGTQHKPAVRLIPFSGFPLAYALDALGFLRLNIFSLSDATTFCLASKPLSRAASRNFWSAVRKTRP